MGQYVLIHVTSIFKVYTHRLSQICVLNGMCYSCAQLQRHMGSSTDWNEGRCEGCLIYRSPTNSFPLDVLIQASHSGCICPKIF